MLLSITCKFLETNKVLKKRRQVMRRGKCIMYVRRWCAETQSDIVNLALVHYFPLSEKPVLVLRFFCRMRKVKEWVVYFIYFIIKIISYFWTFKNKFTNYRLTKEQRWIFSILISTEYNNYSGVNYLKICTSLWKFIFIMTINISINEKHNKV